jgi:hypothetical protein
MKMFLLNLFYRAALIALKHGLFFSAKQMFDMQDFISWLIFIAVEIYLWFELAKCLVVEFLEIIYLIQDFHYRHPLKNKPENRF